MNEAYIVIKHKYKKGDIFSLPNKNNDKSMTCEVMNVSISFNMSSSASTDVIQYAAFGSEIHPYKVYYLVEVLGGSFYDTAELKVMPKEFMMLNLE
jgi:hypothetical protein